LKRKEVNPEILKHELVPKHIILSPQEKEELLKKYGIKENQLPKIYASDPIVRLIGAKPGDVIKIIREFEGKKSVYYRLVVKK